VAFLDQHPALKKAVANQYQAILVAGAAAFSALTLSPLPLLLLAGAELMTMPFIIERLKRRIEIEKKHASRQAVALSREQLLEALPRPALARFERLRELVDRVRENYQGLSPESQAMVGDQAAKFGAILGSCLKRLWLLHRYDELRAQTDPVALADEIAALRTRIESPQQPERVRAALTKNLEIRGELLKALERNEANRAALAAEIDSLEALLELLLQKSVAATDALAFSAEIDDVLHHIESDAEAVEEMERMLQSIPADFTSEPEPSLPPLPELLKRRAAPPPPPPPPPARTPRGRERR
jgi:hypothetical protein